MISALVPRNTAPWILCILTALALILVASPAYCQTAPKAKASPRLWVLAYYANWIQRDGTLAPTDIDYKAFTHLIQFSIIPNADGTIDTTPDRTVNADESAAVIAPAHAAGDKVLICVGGENTARVFGPAISDSNRAATVRSIVDFVTSRGYDGVDIDFEELTDAYVDDYAKFIKDLRSALDRAGPGLLLTAAVASEPKLFASLQDQFDRIDLMTYDLSGPWQGWVTWFDAPLANGGAAFSNGRPLPCCENMLDGFTNAGVAKDKLGIGIDFYGTAWIGSDGPRQPIGGVTTQGISFGQIMDKYYAKTAYHWDASARSPYLSIDSPQKMFISYDDARAVRNKIAFAREKGLGSVIVWELGGGYRDSEPPGQRDALLQAVKRAWRENP